MGFEYNGDGSVKEASEGAKQAAVSGFLDEYLKDGAARQAEPRVQTAQVVPSITELLGWQQATGEPSRPEAGKSRSANASPWGESDGDKTKVSDKPLATSAEYPNASKAAISTVVAAAALRAGETLVENGKNLKFFDNFSLDPKTGDGRDAERAYWLKQTSAARSTLDQMPKNAKVEGSAEKDGDNIILRGSVLVKGDWPKEDQAKSNRMKVKDENGAYIKDQYGDDKLFPSIHKKGFVHDNVVPGKPVLEIVRDKDNELRSFAIPYPDKDQPGFKLEEYAQSVVNKVWDKDGKAGLVEFPMYEKVEEGSVKGLEGMIWKDGGYISEYKYKFVDGANEKGYLSYEEQKIQITRSLAAPPLLPDAVKMDQRMLIVHVAKDGRVFRTIDIEPKHMKRADLDKLMQETQKKIN